MPEVVARKCTALGVFGSLAATVSDSSESKGQVVRALSVDWLVAFPLGLTPGAFRRIGVFDLG